MLVFPQPLFDAIEGIGLRAVKASGDRKLTFNLFAASITLGSLLPLAASLPNGGFGATAKLCKLRFLRIADLGRWRSIVGWAFTGLNDRFHRSVVRCVQVQLRSGFRPFLPRLPKFDERVTLSPLSLFF